VSVQHGTEPLLDRTSFEILIFKTIGRQPGGVAVGDLREYLGKFGNVSVYDAGFRLPYYGSKRDEIGEDWLSIAADQGRRLSQSQFLPEALQTQNKYMLELPAPGRIFGAVEIDTNHERRVALQPHAKDPIFLQIQSGRDRLHDNNAFYQLRDLVRFSVDYYANRYRALKLDAEERERPSEAPSKKLNRAVDLLEENKTRISPAVYRALSRELSEASEGRKIEERVAEERAALLAPLASAGMTALALNHEISRESTFLGRIGRRLRALAAEHSLPELLELAKEFDEARKRLDSVRELFAPLLTDEDRSATDRLRVRAVVGQVIQGMSVLMPGVKIHFDQIPADLRFPLGSLAEWSALLQNVFANAWNAMLESTRREILLTGSRGNASESLYVSDTGQGLGIPLSESTQLFEPFERRLEVSRDKRSIAIGGQGLGLAIVRMLARRRKANVAFIEPSPGFSTTFELSWRRPK
jgi:signal transduction histidine kinase